MNIMTLHQIRTLIEETNDAFESCAGSVNTDYAAFASMRLPEFKTLLNQPDMTGQELRRLIRRGGRRHGKGRNEADWSSFIAGYMSRKSNENSDLTFQERSATAIWCEE